MKWKQRVCVFFVACLTGCAGLQPASRYVLLDFKRAPAHDREVMANPVLSELRKRIGMSMDELVKLIGEPEINTVDAKGNGLLKYTVFHKGDGWDSFPVTIRSWKVVEVGEVEHVIQM